VTLPTPIPFTASCTRQVTDPEYPTIWASILIQCPLFAAITPVEQLYSPSDS
jgi:hypothetical protein